MDKRIITLLENKKQDIITTIEMVAEDSLMPDYFGNYDIYLDDRDGEIYVFQTYSPTSVPASKSLRFLYTIKSHAAKAGDFKRYLMENDHIINAEESEKELIRQYRGKYNEWSQKAGREVMLEVLNADLTYDKILEQYKSIL